jgi:hypothetical protein
VQTATLSSSSGQTLHRRTGGRRRPWWPWPSALRASMGRARAQNRESRSRRTRWGAHLGRRTTAAAGERKSTPADPLFFLRSTRASAGRRSGWAGSARRRIRGRGARGARRCLYRRGPEAWRAGHARLEAAAGAASALAMAAGQMGLGGLAGWAGAGGAGWVGPLAHPNPLG